ncbi:hypothetical protein Goshw_026409, partial [Gossypium schwendimanii]|nr:hypothetical protein [Gossypium schwendimanii]
MIKDGENHHGLWGASDGDGVSLFGATIFPFTIAPMALLMSFKDPQPNSYSADQKIHLTVALNHFSKGLEKTMLRCQFGFIHGNKYSTPDTFGAKEVTCRSLLKLAQCKNWNWYNIYKEDIKYTFKVVYQFDFFKAQRGSGSRPGPLIVLKDFFKEVRMI